MSWRQLLCKPDITTENKTPRDRYRITECLRLEVIFGGCLFKNPRSSGATQSQLSRTEWSIVLNISKDEALWETCFSVRPRSHDIYIYVYVYIYRERYKVWCTDRFLYVLIYTHCLLSWSNTRGPWRQCDLTLHSGVRIQVGKRAFKNASGFKYLNNEVRVMSQNQNLDHLYYADRKCVILVQYPRYILL